MVEEGQEKTRRRRNTHYSISKKALIKSKGVDPPVGSRKAPFETAWNKVKDDADWKRNVFFNENDKKELELLEEDNPEDEE